MDNRPVNPHSVASLICDGLGYCCEWKFFSLYRRTAVIADRLGVTDRAVRNHKRAFREGKLKCLCEKNCMKGATRD